ncbi:MAG: sulfotransferase [Pseudomonadota bacterium]
MPAGTRPNFFIVGAQKAGTSGLAAWLGQHPQVFMSFPKEPGYLAFLEKGYPFLDGYGRPSPARQFVVGDKAAYLKLFSSASDRQTIRGEASTWYFSLPGVAERIKNFSPDAKVLVILRNPMDRAYSAWCHARRDHLEPCEEFSRALEMEQERGEVEFLLRYHRMGMYSDSLAEYQSVFSLSHLMVLFYEDLVGDPEAVWKRLRVFLEIDSSGAPPRPRRLNRSGQPRSMLLQHLLRSHRLKTFVLSIAPYRSAIWIKETLDKANLKRFPRLDERTRLQLQDYYREDVEKLARMTQRDLSPWLM